MNKITLIVFAIISSVLFTACTQSIEERKTACKNDGKQFKVKKVLNLRTGEYEKKGICI